jgi:methionyl-tRNA formyltransferase
MRQSEKIVGIVVHPSGKEKRRDEIVADSRLPANRIFDGSSLRTEETIAAIRRLQPEIGVSALFGYILKPEFLALFAGGVVNLHPALLPFNRGQYPNVWSIVEGTPAGATLHYINEGIDTGDIIAQREVPVEPIDTGATLYAKLEDCCTALFSETWPLIRSGTAPRTPQRRDTGTSHRTRDTHTIDHIDLERSYPARELINILRARTFPPYSGAYFIEQGRRVNLRLHLEYWDDDDA